MGRPRPKVSKSTVRGQPFAVKAIQRAKLQQRMDAEELAARFMFQIPIEVSEEDIVKEIMAKIGTFGVDHAVKWVMEDYAERERRGEQEENEPKPGAAGVARAARAAGAAVKASANGSMGKEVEEMRQAMMELTKVAAGVPEELSHAIAQTMALSMARTMALDRVAGAGEGAEEDGDEAGIDEEETAQKRIMQRILRYRFYNFLKYGKFLPPSAEEQAAAAAAAATAAATAMSMESPTKFEAAEVPGKFKLPDAKKTELKRIEHRRPHRKPGPAAPATSPAATHAHDHAHAHDHCDHDHCDDGCTNPYCPKYTLESVPGLYVPTYSFLLHTGCRPAAAYIEPPPETPGDPYDEAGRFARADAPRLPPVVDHLDHRFLRSHLTYGKTGHGLLISAVAEGYNAGSNTPRFMSELEMVEERSWRLRRIGCPYTSSTKPSVPASTCTKPMILVPTHYRDFLLTFVNLDLAKPILMDGWVSVNGHRVTATIIPSGTELVPSFRQGFERIWGRGSGRAQARAAFDIDTATAAAAAESTLQPEHPQQPASFLQAVQRQLTNWRVPDFDSDAGLGTDQDQPDVLPPTRRYEIPVPQAQFQVQPPQTPNQNQPQQPLTDTQVLSSLKGALAMELRGGMLMGRVGRLQDLVAAGNQKIKAKAAAAKA